MITSMRLSRMSATSRRLASTVLKHKHNLNGQAPPPAAATVAVIRVFSSAKDPPGKDKDETHYRRRAVVPGASQYGSLQDFRPGSPASDRNSRKAAAAAASWQAADNEDVQRVTVKAMIYELIHQQTETIEQTVPWFLSNMPSSYFRQVPEWLRMDHIKAIAAVKDANMDLYLNLSTRLPDGRQVLTFIRPGTEAGTLLKMVQELPNRSEASEDDSPLSRLHVFSTTDESMSLNMFVYGKSNPNPTTVEFIEDVGGPILQYAKDLQEGQTMPDNTGDVDVLAQSPLFEVDELKEYMSRCTETYIRIGSENPKRFLQQRALVGRVAGSECTAVHIGEAADQPGHYWVDMAVANSLPDVALESLCRLLYVHQFDIIRARLDIIPDKNQAENGPVIMLRTLVTPVANSNADTPETFQLLAHELKRAKWLDPATHELVFMKYPELGVTRGELITGLCQAIHPVLAKVNALAFSNTSILETVSNPRFIGHASAIADLFLDRFHPKRALSQEEFDNRCAALKQVLKSDVEDAAAQQIFSKMINVVRHTLKTNVYMPERYALGLRLDPACMVAPGEEHKELPYGVLFIHGRRFNGFHVRFRDIARGGMRLVTPSSAEQYALESARQYDECYGLAFAQQLKNKDIPEGGSKAVNLINTTGLTEHAKNFVMRKSVKAMTDSILDLIVDTPYTKEHMVDLYGKPEVLYLGPDEQVIPQDIDWIIKRAAERGYGTPAAFMSSKPKAGINHKEYGVTSEGVNVYLDVALRQVLGIDPTKDSFTIKMTGGPDGDVAGNELKILIREYGDNVKVVGVADHSGCAEDPEGLSHEELMRLFHEGKCISHFDSSKLGSAGVLHLSDNPAGVKARNTMHNRLEADAFLPCGGRPNTIDIKNYHHFLKPDGTPSSPLIVEGANLFVTAEARQALFENAGVAIVKDSSANKGGVITSSYEICAAMLLSEDEFFDNKQQIVAEVLEKLRGLAQLEALLLFREFENYGGSLPEVSQIISNCINVTTDALAGALDELTEEDRKSLLPLFRAHLPKTIADMSFDHLQERVPDQYIKNAIASCLASKMVYREGTKFIESQPKEKLAAMALKYIKKEKEVAQLMETLSKADMPESQKKDILKLLEQGGARTALQMI